MQKIRATLDKKGTFSGDSLLPESSALILSLIHTSVVALNREAG